MNAIHSVQRDATCKLPPIDRRAYKYKLDGPAPHTNAYLRPKILAALRETGARRVIDLGCGNGFLARDLIEAGYEVVGIDPSPTGIEACRKLNPTAVFHCASLYGDPSDVPETGFDAAVSTEVVEHLVYPRELPRFAKAKLKPGGWLIVTTPYHGYAKNLAICLAGKWDYHHTTLDDKMHIKFWSRATLTTLLESESFKARRFVGCGRSPYLWKSMLLMGQLPC